MKRQSTWAIFLLVASTICAFGQVRDENRAGEGRVIAPGAPQGWFGASRAILYDNGPLVNSPGTGLGGFDESLLQDVSLGLNTLGFGHQLANANRVADDFSVGTEGWIIDTLTFFAYQSFTTTTSTITGVNAQIWDGPPGMGGSSVVWGDTVTNILSSTAFSGILRATQVTTGTVNDRPIMAQVCNVGGAVLNGGTYWLDWQTDGSASFSGPWAPPITINGSAVTGNGMQSLAGVWGPANDSGTGTPTQGFPFIVDGMPNLVVPTLSQYGLAGLLLLLTAAGLYMMRKNAKHLA